MPEDDEILKNGTVDFSRIMVTNSLQELLAATIGIQ